MLIKPFFQFFLPLVLCYALALSQQAQALDCTLTYNALGQPILQCDSYEAESLPGFHDDVMVASNLQIPNLLPNLVIDKLKWFLQFSEGIAELDVRVANLGRDASKAVTLTADIDVIEAAMYPNASPATHTFSVTIPAMKGGDVVTYLLGSFTVDPSKDWVFAVTAKIDTPIASGGVLWETNETDNTETEACTFFSLSGQGPVPGLPSGCL